MSHLVYCRETGSTDSIQVNKASMELSDVVQFIVNEKLEMDEIISQAKHEAQIMEGEE
jgi:hypothetical protein